MSEPSRRPEPGSEQRANEKVVAIVETALARGAVDPLALDISELTSFSDTFVLLTGRSNRAVRAIADAIIERLRELRDAPLGVEGLDEAHWVLIDCNDVVVHVFEPEIRELYSLDRLWSDAPRIDLVALGVPAAALADASHQPSGGRAAGSDLG